MDYETLIVYGNDDYSRKRMLMQKGVDYYQTGHYQTALAVYEEAIQIDPNDAVVYVRKADCLRKLKQYQSAVNCYEQAIVLEPNNVSAYIGKCYSFIKLGDYETALVAFEIVIRLDSKNATAYNCRGMIYRLEDKYEDALKAFTEAILLSTEDDNLAGYYYNKGLTLCDLKRYYDALKAYENAIWLEPEKTKYLNEKKELLSRLKANVDVDMNDQALLQATQHFTIPMDRANTLFDLKRYQEALPAFQQVLILDIDNIAAHVIIGDIYTSLHSDEEAATAYDKALELAQKDQQPDHLWLVANPSRAPFRPADIQFELLRLFIIKAPQDTRVSIALTGMNALYEHLFESQNVSAEKHQINMQKLARMLEYFPEADRSEDLQLITGKDDLRTVQILIDLEPFAITGLGILAQQLTLGLIPEPRRDDLFVRFYHVLDSYGVPAEDSDWLFCRELMAERLYVQAKSILFDLVKRRPAPDIIWLLVEALRESGESPQRQVATLQHFINVASPADERYGDGWKRIGELYEQQLQNGIEAIKAYEQAAKYDKQFQQGIHYQTLEDFYAGRWDAIPGLRSHPDYAFPPVIVIDLESEYRPEAPSDPLVFEVGAVCMKGCTELKSFHALIQCKARKVAHRQHEAKPLEDVVKALRGFIKQSQQGVENAIIVGHNLQEFDAPQLGKMGISITDDQIIDTLTFARHLYPDSLQHNLSLLCAKHEIPLEEAHQALPDARACAHLLYALGNELVARGEHLLAGFRAFVPPGSVFDRVVLQPRQQEACSEYPWELNPESSPARVLRMVKDSSPSSKIVQAIRAEVDVLVERFDPEAAYAGYLPSARKTVVSVATRTRLEQLLVVATGERTDYFVLPDPRTLLCPRRLRECIEQEEDAQVQLALFCLYQASHNHDAATLYPLRLPLKEVKSTPIDEAMPRSNCNSDLILYRLRQNLLEACCASEWEHAECCSASLAANKAAETSLLLLATHESFLHQKQQSVGDLLIVDDLDDLQMHFAEYLAERVTDQEVWHWSKDSHRLFAETITTYLQEHGSRGASHERIPFSRFLPYATQPRGDGKQSLLALLKEEGNSGKAVADKLESFGKSCLQNLVEPGRVQAYWLDLQVASEQEDANTMLQKWSINGLNQDLRQSFTEIYWKPYRQHILCGTALKLGAKETQFIRQFFGIPVHVPFAADQRPPRRVFIPTETMIRPSSFLGRRPWAESAGSFVYQLAQATRETLLVSLASPELTEALAKALHTQEKLLNRRVVSPYLDWTTAKMAERLADDAYPTVALISPYLRKVALNGPVGIELTGPLRFLNQRDPLVDAQIRAYATQGSKDGPFTSYLLPQALLELKARTASQAELHIILDSALRDAVYRDEVFNLFKDGEILDALPDSPVVKQDPSAFVEALTGELDREGFSSSLDVSDNDLHEALQTYWQKESFRTSPLDQKEVVRGVLAGKDQLVIAATGGGKSLCFQLPAMLLAQDVVPKVTLVISPLIALMSDQITSLRRMGVFSAVEMNSMLSAGQREHYLQGIKRGDYSIIYIAPEQVHSSALLRALRRRTIGLIAIDEAHCVSQWGHNFRTDYFVLKKWIDEEICVGYKRDFPLLAVTATARKGHMVAEGEGRKREKATVEDIVEKLGLDLDLDEVQLTSPERAELELRVEHIALPCPNCQNLSTKAHGEVRCEKCRQLFTIEKEDIRQAKIHTLIQLLSTSGEGGLRQRWDQAPGMRQRGIVYCRTVNETVNVCKDITDALPTLRVDVYHGNTQKLPREKRDLTFRRFMSDEEGEHGLDIVVATNAFGMGIDARRLGFVIHFDVPPTLEAYYQEAGRAGRDPAFQAEKDRAQCILLYHVSDLESQRSQIGRNRITQQDIELVYDALHRLKGAAQQEVLVTEEEIALFSGVDTDKIVTCLFYLHYYTRMNGTYVLERQENAAKLKQIKFEWGYQQRISDPILHPLSKRLAEVFSTTPDFRLNEEQTVIIDTVELAAYLNWKLTALDDEIKNLARRQIIAIASPVFIKWARNRKNSCAVIAQLVKDIRTLLNSADDRSALQNGNDANVAVQSLYDEGELTAVSLPTFTHFLSELAKTGAGDRQLFETFKKTVNTSGQECYKLRLKLSSQPSVVTEVMNTLMNLREELLQAIQRFGHEALADEWLSIDLLAETPDHMERQRLNRSLLLLNIVRVLTFPVEERRDVVMRVNFLQDSASSDDLKIDLTSLRQVERYGERKLALMQEYALSPEERRGQLLRAYFLGEQPLIEPFVPRQDLTDEQGALVSLTEGYHLIQGPAGSGKTTLLQEHFRYLVEHQLVPAERILVTAHFHSAVDRLGNHLNYLQSGGRPIPTKTLHKLSEGIFRQNRHLLKRVDGQLYFPEQSSLRVLSSNWKENEERELELVSHALERLHREKSTLDFLPANMERPQLTSSYKLNAVTEKDCLEAINLFRLRGIVPALIAIGDDNLTALTNKLHSKSWIHDKLAFYYAAYISYQFIQGEQSVYTFDDQILFALAILKANPDIAKQWQRKYEHIIIDEFQDFSPAAAELVGILSARQKNVMAVGDIGQRILTSPKERGTLTDSFELVGNDIPVEEHLLTNNFRSVQEILDFANAVQPYGSDWQHAVRGIRGIRPAVVQVSLPDSLPASAIVRAHDEAVVQQMADAALHYMRLLPPEDAGSVAFLVAGSALTQPLRLHLEHKNQPFILLENKYQYQSHRVKRILTYFRLIQDSTQTSEVAYFLRNCISPYFNFKQINKLKAIAQQREQTLLETALEYDTIEQIGATNEHFESLQQHVAVIRKHSPASICNEVLRSIRELQEVGVEVQVEEQERVQVEEPAEEMIEREEAFGKLDEFKTWTIQKALEHIDSHITFLENNRAYRKLVVTTIYNAKSQDFDTVFLIGANLLRDRRRWYVSVSRARQRFYCLVDASKGNEVLSSIPNDLFEVISWPG